MVEIGKIQQMEIANIVPIGAYLDGGTDNPKDNILLPNNQLPDDAKEGDLLEVFIYRDSEDRLIATMKKPLGQAGELAYLKVAETTQIGAFMDLGLEKDLLLPFSEQKYKVQVGRSYLVMIYVDKSGRLSATTDIEKNLRTDGPHSKEDWVKGTVYMVKSDMGAFVAVDDLYKGLIHSSEYFNDIKNGDRVDCRIIKIRDDGKLDLSPRKIAHKQQLEDADIILKELQEKDGFIPLNDKSNPEEIKYRLHMSKAAFKRGVGKLLKEQKIIQTEDGLKLK